MLLINLMFLKGKESIFLLFETFVICKYETVCEDSCKKIPSDTYLIFRHMVPFYMNSHLFDLLYTETPHYAKHEQRSRLLLKYSQN